MSSGGGVNIAGEEEDDGMSSDLGGDSEAFQDTRVLALSVLVGVACAGSVFLFKAGGGGIVHHFV